MGKKIKKRKILNIIREVSIYDFVNDPRRKSAAKDSKFKIVFYKPKPDEKTNIPKKFQGVQYYKNKSEAELALNDREKLMKILQDKKKKSMIGNNRAEENAAVNAHLLVPFQKKRKKIYDKKVKRSEQLLKQGKSKLETQRSIIEEFNLERSLDTGTSPYIREAEENINKK